MNAEMFMPKMLKKHFTLHGVWSEIEKKCRVLNISTGIKVKHDIRSTAAILKTNTLKLVFLYSLLNEKTKITTKLPTIPMKQNNPRITANGSNASAYRKFNSASVSLLVMLKMSSVRLTVTYVLFIGTEAVVMSEIVSSKFGSSPAMLCQQLIIHCHQLVFIVFVFSSRSLEIEYLYNQYSNTDYFNIVIAT
jgi:hypothetical protein